MKLRIASAIVALVFGALFSVGAQAQATRTWVSGVGDDANPCSRTAPCKTFAGAISKTAAGGAISVLDPGGFGAVTITKAITIEGDGVVAGILSAGTNGMIINAGVNDAVVLRGIRIEGIGTGLNGIRVLQAGSVVIDGCTFNNFTTHGIDINVSNSTRVTVRDTIFDKAGGAAISAVAAAGMIASVEVEDVRISNSARGVYAQANSRVHATRTQVSGNTNSAFEADGSVSTARIVVDAGSATQSATGVLANGANGKVTLAHTTITDNTTGIDATNGGQVHSFGNNRIVDNSTNGAPSTELGEQ